MAQNRWQRAQVERGKPRTYIQQYLDLRLPEDDYLQVVKELGLQDKPFDEVTASRVMDTFIEDLDDGSQFDSVHVQHGDGLVVLITVISFPYRQETMDRLMAEHLARKAMR